MFFLLYMWNIFTPIFSLNHKNFIRKKKCILFQIFVTILVTKKMYHVLKYRFFSDKIFVGQSICFIFFWHVFSFFKNHVLFDCCQTFLFSNLTWDSIRDLTFLSKVYSCFTLLLDSKLKLIGIFVIFLIKSWNFYSFNSC